MDIHSKLKDRYSGLEWATAFEVADQTGGARRRCDMLAMGLWQSKGLYLHGHEIKVSRSDWLKEIDDPSKADAFAKRCHYWWIVAPKGIVKLEELPANWGLLHCGDNSALRVGKAATKHEPEALTFRFFASCLRAFSDQSDIEKQLKREYQRGVQDANKRHDARSDTDIVRQLKPLQYKIDNYERAIANFESGSGIKIDSYHGRRIGEATKLAQKLVGHESLGAIMDKCGSALESLSKLADELRNAEVV